MPFSTSRSNTGDSRRSFLRLGTSLAGASFLSLGKALSWPAATDPFDALPKSVWERARNNGLVMIRRPAPQNLASRTEIVTADEPGVRIVVTGRVFAPDGATPAEGITVYAYNTDAAGHYSPEGFGYPPRLYGWMKTDAAGGFELLTIRPGRYPGMHVASHIHFT